MELHEWLGELVGLTGSSASFYSEFFKVLLENGRVYYADLPSDWSPRSKQWWVARLASGTTTQAGLNIVRRTREGRQGRIFFVWSAAFLAQIQKLYFRVKRDIL